MKTVRKLLIALLMLMYIIGTSGNVMAAGESISVDSLEVQYEKNVNVSLNNGIDVNSLGEGDVKILHDITVLSSDLDPADARKVLISLDEELSENAIYNLITIEGPDSSLDFETGTNLEGEEIFNEAGEGIESISIIDPKNIEVSYFDAVTDTEVILKLFRDLPISSLNSISNTEIGVETKEALSTSNNYIFMLIAARNIDNSQADIESGIYNFETPSYLEQAPVEQIDDVSLNAASEDTDEENIETQNENVESEDTSTTAIEEEATNEQSEEIQETVEEVTKATDTTSNEAPEESNIEAVAAEATAVPETGTATNIMILLTMLLAFGVQMKRRK